MGGELLSIFVDDKTWTRVPIRLVGAQRSAASLQLASFSLGLTVSMHVVERKLYAYLMGVDVRSLRQPINLQGPHRRVRPRLPAHRRLMVMTIPFKCQNPS